MAMGFVVRAVPSAQAMGLRFYFAGIRTLKKGHLSPLLRMSVPFRITLNPTLATNSTCPCLAPLVEAQDAATTEVPVDLLSSSYEGRTPGAEAIRFTAHTPWITPSKYLLSLVGVGHVYFPY